MSGRCKGTLCCVIIAMVGAYHVESVSPDCSTECVVRTDALQTDENCGSVEGRVQICEEGEWRDLRPL